MPVYVRPLILPGLGAFTLAVVAGCGGAGDQPEIAADAVSVTATDTACQVAKARIPAGTVHFAVTNKGAKATEFYVYAPGDRKVDELHNVDPGDTEQLTVTLAAGSYQVACKPGKQGDGIRQAITVVGSGGTAASDPRLARAVDEYRTYVQQQVDATLSATQRFAAAVKAGDVAQAKQFYAPSRVGWERVEPVAESFGDIDPKVDLREADLEAGQQWTGWHRLEKALWVKGSTAGEERYADQLLADLRDLQQRVKTAEITPTSMANGAKELLDEVATGKVTGEEEAFSHTDLWDFAANVEGARKVYELLKPVVQQKDAALAQRLDAEFAKVEGLLAKYRSGDGYVSYDTVTEPQRKELSDAVNGLAEPLSKLAGTVAG